MTNDSSVPGHPIAILGYLLPNEKKLQHLRPAGLSIVEVITSVGSNRGIN